MQFPAPRYSVRLARSTDWPRIQAWRELHFEKIFARSDVQRPVTGQHGPGDAVWLVLDLLGQPVAALSYTDDEDVRWVWDLYAAPRHVFAGMRLARVLEGMCDREGREIRCKTDPENSEFIRILIARQFEPVAVEFKRSPRVAKHSRSPHTWRAHGRDERQGTGQPVR